MLETSPRWEERRGGGQWNNTSGVSAEAAPGISRRESPGVVRGRGGKTKSMIIKDNNCVIERE